MITFSETELQLDQTEIEKIEKFVGLNFPEEYKKHITSENLIDNNDEIKVKLETVNEITSLLSDLVPFLIKFAHLEYKLESLYK
jgi:Ca2+-binding EF-hand superfamily protein